jgi:hypothetical protein
MTDLLSNAVRAENMSLKDQIAERDEVCLWQCNVHTCLLAHNRPSGEDIASYDDA